MRGIITWFVGNTVAANLLMMVFVLGGVLGLLITHQEEFPNIDPDVVMVSVPYLGAAPEEAESGVCIRIEEALEGVEGIDELHASAYEGQCSVRAMLLDGVDGTRALNEIKSKIDGINTFPAETEKPITSKLLIRAGVMEVALHGAADEAVLKELGQQIRDDIVDIDGVSQVDLSYVRPYEISIEVSELTLRQYGLTLARVADAVRATSLDLPAGSIRTEGGEILLRTKGQAYRGGEFEDIVVLTRPDGSRVHLGDIARVVDGFQEGDTRARFDGNPAVVIKVYRVGKEDIVAMADKVKAYVATRQAELPAGLKLTVWMDESRELVDRLDTLVTNAASGLALVLVTLALFLRFRLALWVAVGIPVALLGAVMLFPYVDISISSLAVMAFILVIGIVVDDAIVVSERIYSLEMEGKTPREAAIEGTVEVSVPVIFGVLTTMAAFLPLLIVPGRMGDFFGVIGWVVIICLTFSVIESQMILPAHLAHRRHRGFLGEGSRLVNAWLRMQDAIARSLVNFSVHVYRPFLVRTIAWRYVAAAVAVAVLVLALGMIASGRVTFSFFPSIEGDRVFATVVMPEGIDADVTAAAAGQIERAAEQLRDELQRELGSEAPVVKHILTSIGTQVERGGGPPRIAGPGVSHIAEVAIELLPLRERGNRSSKDIAARWRELTGAIPDVVELTFNADSFSAGDPINFELRGRDVDALREAAAELRAELARYDGVTDIADSFRSGKQEIQLQLKPEARNFGVSLADVARQVRQAFYGEEAQRIQRGPDDVRVMVRYPEDERRSIGNLEDMRIRTPEGIEVPFTTVAELVIGRGYSTINRLDGERVVNVRADVNRSQTTPEAVIASVQQDFMPGLMQRYGNVRYALAGEQKERAKAMLGLAVASVMALFIIYALLAIPLRSYLQPLVIMSVIPFGAVGAIVGHWVMNWDLMFFSMLGIVALSGVVVNSSLVMVDYVNHRRAQGSSMMEAVLDSGVARFRPIVLTSTTTFIGLVPLMALASPSTAFIIPMAISLAYGVLFATVITLVLVPCLYVMVEDWLALLHRFFSPVPDEMDLPAADAHPELAHPEALAHGEPRPDLAD